MIKNYIKIFFLLFVFASCSSNDKADALKPKHFFDLKAYFQAQIEWNEQYGAIQKTVGIDGKMQTKTLDEIDWEKELNMFVTADINKVAWHEKYQIDTMATINAVNIVYTALEDDLKTRIINIKFDKDTVKHISIEQLSDNMIYNSKKRLNYSSKEGYTLENRQKARFLKEHFYEINVEF